MMAYCPFRCSAITSSHRSLYFNRSLPERRLVFAVSGLDGSSCLKQLRLPFFMICYAIEMNSDLPRRRHGQTDEYYSYDLGSYYITEKRKKMSEKI